MALDRIVEIGDGKAVAVRNVPATLAVFDTHFPNKPVLPGVLILGSIARLASLLAADATGSTGWLLASAGRVRYRHFVAPGDELELAVQLVRSSDDEVVCKGSASVEGRAVTTFGTLALRRHAPASPSVRA